jgi:signal peptidase I
VVAILAVCTAVVAADARPAQAAPIETVVTGDVVTLVSIGDPDLMLALRAGVPVEWVVGVDSDAHLRTGSIDVTTSGTGDADLALRYTVEECSTRWDAAGCSGRVRTLIADDAVPLDGAARPLLDMAVGASTWLRYTVTMPTAVAADVDGSVSLTVRATGMGDDVAVSPDSPDLPSEGSGLPVTGGGDAWPAAWLGLALLATGAAVMAGGRSRRRGRAGSG